MTDYKQPNAIPLIDPKCSSDVFENAIRIFGVGNASEWFGYPFNSSWTDETVQDLLERSGGVIQK
jgi:hypothetical protein